MIKFDILDYGVWQEGKHISDFDDLDHAKFFAQGMAINQESDVVILNNFTGDIVAEFEVKFRIEVVEVEP